MSNKKPKCCLEDCNKKLKLIDLSMKCKCNNYYCELHRHPENHNCTYDYRQENMNKVEEMKCIFNKLVDRV